FWWCGGGLSGAAFHVFLKNPPPFLQLPAPRRVKNQQKTGVDGSGKKGNWFFLLIAKHDFKKKPPVETLAVFFFRRLHLLL
ncbi:hypothetical protein BEJ61_18100, partial [Escherichia coli]|uniref:hypothetical protein n=1 Tax=Escherichia coli TaxID=562 RepID=UPI000E0277B1